MGCGCNNNWNYGNQNCGCNNGCNSGCNSNCPCENPFVIFYGCGGWF